MIQPYRKKQDYNWESIQCEPNLPGDGAHEIGTHIYYKCCRRAITMENTELFRR